jgi:8-oxo-dGTP pyrophosphatase MutT (NUDIX family)
MSKETLSKYANISQYSRKKIFALGNWCNKQGNVFSLQEVFDCLYDYANGDVEELTKLIEQLTHKGKVFGRSSVVFGNGGSNMYIMRGDDGNLEVRAYKEDFEDNKVGQHQPHDPNVIRKDGQVKKSVIKAREKLYDLGAEVRSLYKGQSNNFITAAIKAVKNFAKEHKISEKRVVSRLKSGVYTLDTTDEDNPKVVQSAKTIKLYESQLNDISDVTKLTEYKFYNNVQRFLSDLLRDPVGAKVPFLLQANNIARNQLLYHLKSNGIINRFQKISDKDSQGKPKTARMVIKYSVPKKDFAKKMKRLFIDLVAKNVPQKIEKMLTEDSEISECDGGAAPAGTTNCQSSGAFVQPLFGVQRRKMPTDLEEDTTASSVTQNGDISMGIAVPFGSDKETRDRTPGFSVERQDESEEDRGNDDNFVSAATYIFCKDDEGQMCVLVGRRRGNYGGGLFNVPVGMREPYDDSIVDTAVREVEEETNLSLQPNLFHFVNGEEWGENKVGANFVVRLNGATSSYQIGNGDGENDRFIWIPLDKVNDVQWAYNMDKTVMNMSSSMLNESKRTRRNDKGERVPEKCPFCGGDVRLKLKGEPVFVCDKCEKYFGTLPKVEHFIKKNEIRESLLTEENSINKEVDNEANEVFEIITNHKYKENEVVEKDEKCVVYQMFFQRNFLGCVVDYNVRFYEYNDGEKHELECHSIPMSNKCASVYINYEWERGFLSLGDLHDSIQHELTHIFKGVKCFEKDERYYPVATNISNIANYFYCSNDKNMKAIGCVFYMGLEDEQDAYINGLYAKIKEGLPRGFTPSEVIKDSALYDKVIELLNIRNNIDSYFNNEEFIKALDMFKNVSNYKNGLTSETFRKKINHTLERIKTKYLNMVKAYQKYMTRSGMMIRGDVISILANSFSF